jgi:hypothetical protein
LRFCPASLSHLSDANSEAQFLYLGYQTLENFQDFLGLAV